MTFADLAELDPQRHYLAKQTIAVPNPKFVRRRSGYSAEDITALPEFPVDTVWYFTGAGPLSRTSYWRFDVVNGAQLLMRRTWQLSFYVETTDTPLHPVFPSLTRIVDTLQAVMMEELIEKVDMDDKLARVLVKLPVTLDQIRAAARAVKEDDVANP